MHSRYNLLHRRLYFEHCRLHETIYRKGHLGLTVFHKNAVAVFGKPRPTNPAAHSEYDKFIQQPLRLLAAAHVLLIDKTGRRNIYQIQNEEILEYISRRERNAFSFLYCYFKKAMEDSGMWRYFQEYLENGRNGALDSSAYLNLRDRFIRFMIGHTAINGDVEIRRIFPKILNVFAVENNVLGSERGSLSRYPFVFADLMYNRKNWRDLNKDKSMSRQEAVEESVTTQQESYNAYYVQKAIALVRKIQHETEVHDQWGNGAATQVHHIFPKSKFPQIAHYIENLILLTATQHNTKAHPNNNTQIIDRDYQLVCLLAKSDTIEKSIKRVGDKYYRKESFIYVINTGLTQDLSVSLSFNEIKRQLIAIYNTAQPLRP